MAQKHLATPLEEAWLDGWAEAKETPKTLNNLCVHFLVGLQEARLEFRFTIAPNSVGTHRVRT